MKKTKFSVLTFNQFIKNAEKKKEFTLEDIVPKREFDMFLTELTLQVKNTSNVTISDVLRKLKQKGLSEFQLGAITTGILIPLSQIEVQMEKTYQSDDYDAPFLPSETKIEKNKLINN